MVVNEALNLFRDAAITNALINAAYFLPVFMNFFTEEQIKKAPFFYKLSMKSHNKLHRMDDYFRKSGIRNDSSKFIDGQHAKIDNDPVLRNAHSK